MATLSNPTIDAIYSSYEKEQKGHRGYLGASEIGEECRRMLWYRFRWVRQPHFPGCILRLFETGQNEEARIIHNLRKIGVQVEGQQEEWTAVDGHFKLHVDGIVLGLLESPKTWHVMEIKTSNRKYFAELEKKGVEECKPVHYAQMQMGMGLAELTRAVYIVQNKDTDDLYLERIKFVKADYEGLLRKAASIVYAESPPERIGKDASFYKCKWCDFSNLCHGANWWPDANCRTCSHVTPVTGGKWSCARGLVVDRPVCAEHLFLPPMIHWAEPIAGDETHVEYQADGYRFVNVAATGFPAKEVDHYSSRELRRG